MEKNSIPLVNVTVVVIVVVVDRKEELKKKKRKKLFSPFEFLRLQSITVDN